MKFTIDEDVVKKVSTVDGITLTVEEVVACLLNELCDNGIDVINNLIDRGILVQENTMFYTRIKPFRKYRDLVKKILLLSDNTLPGNDELAPLAKALKDIYPKGRRNDDSAIFWQDSLTATVDRLKSLYKHFPEIKEYTNEQIINATRKYVDMFGNNKTYMRTLNYFLWKRNETITSDLIKILENPDISATDFYDNAEMI